MEMSYLIDFPQFKYPIPLKKIALIYIKVIQKVVPEE